ncbi:MAG: hypothetical protein WDW38_002700 [Sanguina aurantia]
MSKSPARDEQNRNELFAGRDNSSASSVRGHTKKGAININPDAAAWSDDPSTAALSTQQLVDQAVTTHKDTTRTAKRALQVIEDTKRIQAETLVALGTQGEQLDAIGQDLTRMQDDLSYAQRMLAYMRMCCCCQMFGVDPDLESKAGFQNKRERRPKAGASGGSPAKSAEGSSGAGAGGSEFGERPKAQGFKDPNINLGKNHEKEQLGMSHETRKQNEFIDQIYSGLDTILEGAKNMNSELAVQNRATDAVGGQAEATADRIDNMNTHGMLKQYKGTRK